MENMMRGSRRPNQRGVSPPRSSQRSTRAAPKREADAGFAIGTYDAQHIEDNARERADARYGEPEWRDEMARRGLIDQEGEISDRGWAQLNRDIDRIERNALAWMRSTFNNVRDEGHDQYDDLRGTFWFDPTNDTQAWLVELASPSGHNERIDMSDASYGDLADTAFTGVSDFGASVLGGQITFFDVQPEDMDTIEQTTSRASRRRRPSSGSKRRT